MTNDLLSASELGREFLTRSGYILSKLEKADFDDEKKRWVLTFDVGISTPKLKKVEIDESSGKVISFE